MISEFHKAKLKVHHRVLDADQSGFVEEKDFEIFAENFAKIRGYTVGSPQHSDLLSKFRTVWENYWAPADADGDGKVSADEFCQALDSAISSGNTSDELMPALFDLVDQNEDGTISLDEHKMFFIALGIDAEQSLVVFAKLDTDRDGFLSKEEFLQAGRDFFFADEKDAPGNWFWGPVE